jgi:hypothetical protein
MAGCVFYLVSCKFLSLRGVSPCRPVTRPQGGLGAPSSPSRMWSPEPRVVGEALADDARTATPPRGAVESRATSPPVVAARMETPPRAADEAGGASVGGVGATTSLTVIDVDPISAVPGGAEDLVRDQPQIDLAPGGLETSGVQVPPSSSSSPRLPRRSINWNHTPWQEDCFEDNEHMQALRTSIFTINNTLTVSCPRHVAAT